MSQPPKAAFLTRFHPDAVAPTPAPTERLSIALETELRGVRTRLYAEGARLSAELTIAFSYRFVTLCARAILESLAPSEHAPMVGAAGGSPLALTTLAYNGSNCCIVDAATPLPIYSENPGADWSNSVLALNFPLVNLYPFFAWPAPVVRYDPPLTDQETPPSHTLQVVDFRHQLDSVDGVRYPMRLNIDLGSQGTAIVATRNRDDSPLVSGSGTRLTCANQPLFEVTLGDIADALRSVSPSLSYGTYPLDLIIYDSDGVQVFDIVCTGPARAPDPQDPAPQTETVTIATREVSQGGDYGIFEMLRIRAATLYWAPPLGIFRFHGRDSGRKDLLASGSFVGNPENVGSSYWWGNGLALTWGSSGIFISNRRILAVTAMAAAYNSSAAQVLYATWSSQYDRLHFHVFFAASNVSVEIARGVPPHKPRYGRLLTVSFNPAPPWKMLLVLTPTADLTATVMECVLPEILPLQFDPDGIPIPRLPVDLAFSTLSDTPLPTGSDGCTYHSYSSGAPVTIDQSGEGFFRRTTTSHGNHSFSGTLSTVEGAYYNQSGAVVLVDVSVSITGSGEARRHDVYEETWSSTCWWLVICTDPEILGESTWGGSVSQKDNTFSNTYNCTVSINGMSVVAAAMDSHYNDPRNTTETWISNEATCDEQTCRFNNRTEKTESDGRLFVETANYITISLPLLGASARTAIIVGPSRTYTQRSEDGVYSPGVSTTDPAQTFYNRGETIGFRNYSRVDPVAGTEKPVSAAHLLNNLKDVRKKIVFRENHRYEGRVAHGPMSCGYFGVIPFTNYSYSQMEDRAFFLNSARLEDPGVVSYIVPITEIACQNFEYPPIPDWSPPDPESYALITPHNAERGAEGLDPLQWHTALADAAQAHAQWMETTGIFDHTGEGGSSPWQRALEAGYTGSSASENLAYGQTTTAQVMSEWMASPGHRANILNPSWRDFGAYTAESARWGRVWVTVFGA